MCAYYFYVSICCTALRFRTQCCCHLFSAISHFGELSFFCCCFFFCSILSLSHFFFCVLCEVKFYASTLYWRLMYVCRRYRRHLFSVYCLLCIFLFRVIARSFAARTLLIVCPHINWIKFSCVLEPGTFSLVYWLLLMFIRFSYIYIYIFEESE